MGSSGISPTQASKLEDEWILVVLDVSVKIYSFCSDLLEIEVQSFKVFFETETSNTAEFNKCKYKEQYQYKRTQQYDISFHLLVILSKHVL